MFDNTINDAKMIVDGCKDVMLVGRYHIFRLLGQGDMGAITVCRRDMV